MTGTAAGHVVTKASAGTVAETVDRLTTLLAARGLKVFDVIDHSGEACRNRKAVDLFHRARLTSIVLRWRRSPALMGWKERPIAE